MTILWRDIPGQKRVKETLSRSLEKNQIGHAYLFAGAAGTGKFTTALQFALALLCESKEGPCFECASCRRVMGHSHPDFRYLFPINFASEHKVKSQPGKLSEAGWDYIYERAKAKLTTPFLLSEDWGAAIPVDWIREVNKTIQRGPTEGKHAVIIMEGIENFRAEAANAMLKTLEEPPPNTVIILLTRAIHAVLPTVLSRCQIFRFSSLNDEEMLVELEKRYPEAEETQKRIALFRGKGSPGETFRNMQREEDRAFQLANGLIERIAGSQTPFEKALKLEEFVAVELGDDFSLATEVMETFIEEVRIRFLTPYLKGEKYILQDEQSLSGLPDLTVHQAMEMVQCAENTLLSIKRHSPLLFVFAEFELTIMGIIHG